MTWGMWQRMRNPQTVSCDTSSLRPYNHQCWCPRIIRVPFNPRSMLRVALTSVFQAQNSEYSPATFECVLVRELENWLTATTMQPTSLGQHFKLPAVIFSTLGASPRSDTCMKLSWRLMLLFLRPHSWAWPLMVHGVMTSASDASRPCLFARAVHPCMADTSWSIELTSTSGISRALRNLGPPCTIIWPRWALALMSSKSRSRLYYTDPNRRNLKGSTPSTCSPATQIIFRLSIS